MIRTVLFLNSQITANRPIPDYFQRENILEPPTQFEGSLTSESMAPLAISVSNSPDIYERWLGNSEPAEFDDALPSLVRILAADLGRFLVS
jgi:hypothetical protein